MPIKNLQHVHALVALAVLLALLAAQLDAARREEGARGRGVDHLDEERVEVDLRGEGRDGDERGRADGEDGCNTVQIKKQFSGCVCRCISEEFSTMTTHRQNMISLENISDTMFIEFVKSSSTWFELAIQCGCKSLHPRRVSIDYKPLKKRALYLHIDICHLTRKNNNQSSRMKLPQSDLKTRRHTRDLHKDLQKAGRLYICEWCRCDGMELWNGEWLWRNWPIQLQIDHVNGRREDDSDNVDNLRYLCPNCHAQTPNFGGRANSKE